jgi:hypothetical protein
MDKYIYIDINKSLKAEAQLKAKYGLTKYQFAVTNVIEKITTP